jgi:hypothetical protein
MALLDVDVNDDLVRRGRATAVEEGMAWPAYVARALRRQIMDDNAARSAAELRPPRCGDPGE